MSFRQYLDKYNEKWDILHQTAINLPEYRDRTLYTTWDLSFEQVQRQDQHRRTDAASLLRLLAYFDHQDVWYGLLHAGTGLGQPIWFVNLTTDQLVFENTMRTLADFCLVEAHIATESYSLHTCVHDWTLSSLNRVVSMELYDLAFCCVRKLINRDKADQLAYAQNRRLVPHAIRLDHNHFYGLVDKDEWLKENHNAVYSVAWLLQTQRKFLPVEHMYVRALRGKEKAWGPEHTSTLDTVNNLGILYWNQGKMAEAEEMYIRALRGKEKAWGPEHTSTLNTVHNLGILYQNQGKMAEAEQMYVRALQGYERAMGSQHPITQGIARNLSQLRKLRSGDE
jgi:tetratricopeptide (TPR) repeat protein